LRPVILHETMPSVTVISFLKQPVFLASATGVDW
jgi:hypothetical protein